LKLAKITVSPQPTRNRRAITTTMEWRTLFFIGNLFGILHPKGGRMPCDTPSNNDNNSECLWQQEISNRPDAY
jgi:hypothetical protein